MKLDILAFGVHPDDVELGCGGTLIHQIQKGNSVGIIDISRGEMGTRGTPEIRDTECERAKEVIGAVIRENVKLQDVFFQNTMQSQLKIIESIRKYQPEIIFCNALFDRHPDHGRASQLIEDASFYAGLVKVETQYNNEKQKPWRPKIIFHYIQDRFITPHIVVDVTPVWEKKMESIAAHTSQFYNPNSAEPETYISSKFFFENVAARAMEMGRPCGFKYAEGFTCSRTLGVKNIFDIT